MSKTVEAAGAILYRWRQGDPSSGQGVQADPHALLKRLELCMVHRPKYDDWSWPKGKLEAHETHAHAAAREVSEETGRVVRLGPYLGESEYPLSNEGKSKGSHGLGRRKHIVYWMASLAGHARADRLQAVIGHVSIPDPDEVDQVAWLSPKQARSWLTHSSDKQILDLFVDQVEQGALTGATLIIVRHGKSISRKEWSGEDAQRPLTPRGAAAAYALNRELACWAPDDLFSSPWTRCLQTVRPYAAETGQPIEEVDCLTETAFAAQPDHAYAWLDALIEDALTARSTKLVCMHRPVLGGVFDHLRGLCASKSIARLLAKSSPYMPTGTALALHFARGADSPRIIDIQKAIPIVY
ncbi:Phosphohydrolase (MutT/NUDIX family protein) [Bifidobacterium actinocoloniiforme DSM 22766]|uniref:Phosphohydrolase (MutT/NUDIX family protein) n=1 Tax=Bifidobacterium actinocoloniiforme DSM 22766 TaxID=1437605 RepID=A0A086Z2C4_9BIFI|nr:NUDIX domain-containing protein [Bifidobacterium actinocoloniiforme]AKV55684.1 DNA mismatch repair protein MutT [Bifidobacterium actinocoloniiforme DSM 22766]KFI40674.1 Phosphohydrolase (MutT/NUDIX family protein) [Bifidobacterium actinocoloniiforme DSM 22766]